MAKAEAARLQDAGEDWWKRCVFYQIYPRSFQDSDGDGVGDLRGLITRLDHLEWLGVGAVWLSPIYRSPMRDFGYDIADHTAIDPVFGDLDDFDRLLDGLHARSIRLVLDVVPNHTSDQHPWFLESRRARSGPKRDWYVWADPAPDGGPPNNWLSRFGGSAWTLDEPTGQYFYHAFLKEQPDLNWHNATVRKAFAETLRFWLRRGVDGFRVDASAVLAEDPLLRNDPPNPNFKAGETPPPERFTRVFTDGRPETMGYLEEIRAVVDEFPDKVLLGEVQGGVERVGRFYGGERPRFHLPLNTLLLETVWDADSLAANIDRYLNAIPDQAWPVWVIGGHDKPRIASKLGPERARLAALLALTLPGAPIFYAGDEIGARNVPVPPEQVRDPFERLLPGYGLNRDPERAPLRWTAEPKGGFTTGEPWLPMGEPDANPNVAGQRVDPCSMLSLYRTLIRLRREEPALRGRAYQPRRSHGPVLIYDRGAESERLTVLVNLGDKPVEMDAAPGGLLLSTRLDRTDDDWACALRLRPCEGVVVRSRARTGKRAFP
jgi:alpha-glucosidase